MTQGQMDSVIGYPVSVTLRCGCWIISDLGCDTPITLFYEKRFMHSLMVFELGEDGSKTSMVYSYVKGGVLIVVDHLADGRPTIYEIQDKDWVPLHVLMLISIISIIMMICIWHRRKEIVRMMEEDGGEQAAGQPEGEPAEPLPPEPSTE